jgi:hypothetical protein
MYTTSTHTRFSYVRLREVSDILRIERLQHLLPWLHGPFSLALASLTIADHSFLSCALILRLLIPRAFVSASTSSSHLRLGLYAASPTDISTAATAPSTCCTDTAAVCLRGLEEFWGVLSSSEGSWGVLRGLEELWGVLRSYEESWGALSGLEEFWGVLRSYEESWGVMRSLEEFWGVLRSSEEAQKSMALKSVHTRRLFVLSAHVSSWYQE